MTFWEFVGYIFVGLFFTVFAGLVDVGFGQIVGLVVALLGMYVGFRLWVIPVLKPKNEGDTRS